MKKEKIIDLYNKMLEYDSDTVCQTFLLYSRGEIIKRPRTNITPLEEYAITQTYEEYLDNDEMKFINEELTEIFDESKFRLSDDDLFEQTINLFEELDNYDFNYNLRKSLNMKDKEDFNLDKIEEIIYGDIDKFIDYFKELEENEHLQYLIETSVFDSECYDNMVGKIIPSLEYIKENKERDKDFEM